MFLLTVEQKKLLLTCAILVTAALALTATVLTRTAGPDTLVTMEALNATHTPPKDNTGNENEESTPDEEEIVEETLATPTEETSVEVAEGAPAEEVLENSDATPPDTSVQPVPSVVYLEQTDHSYTVEYTRTGDFENQLKYHGPLFQQALPTWLNQNNCVIYKTLQAYVAEHPEDTERAADLLRYVPQGFEVQFHQNLEAIEEENQSLHFHTCDTNRGLITLFVGPRGLLTPYRWTEIGSPYLFRMEPVYDDVSFFENVEIFDNLIPGELVLLDFSNTAGYYSYSLYTYDSRDQAKLIERCTDWTAAHYYSIHNESWLEFDAERRVLDCDIIYQE